MSPSGGLRPTDWKPQPPTDRLPPPGSPNVVAIVLDDTGFAQLGCFGSDIATPAMDSLAGGGLRYNRFHVTALCSPTRACFLTGRNHHAVGMGFLADIPLSYPGYTARLPASAAALPRVLRDNGYSTLAVGKWHLTPRWQRSDAGPFDHWPLGTGFERYYGFLQGDNNQWSPNLVCDNHYVDPPAGAEDGYHLSEDLVDRAIGYLADQQHAAPGKPFFLYLAFGAMHAPHHVAPKWVEPYRGRYDGGWDAWRAECFERQLATGVVPAGTVLTDRPSWVTGWDDLGADERRLLSRQQEVFAGFLTHTDAQIGRLVAHLARSGLLEDTLILLFSDNGASAEGGTMGTINEHRFTARRSDGLAEIAEAYDEWGGRRGYYHYSWGWAWAGNTPMRLWKRYTWLGGTRTPLVVHWPRSIAARGEIRAQFSHVVDLAPTVLDAVGLAFPESVDGVTQQPVDGASLRPTFDDPSAADPRDTQYFEMLGSRSIYFRGWKATTDFISTGVVEEEELAVGSRDFDDDHWALFDLGTDFSESTDVSSEHPDRVRRLQELWFSEAGRNNVLPIDGTLINRFGALVPPAWGPGTDRTFTPLGTGAVDESVPPFFGGFTLTALVDVPDGGAQGVLAALGDYNGGYALWVEDGRPVFTCNRAGDALEVAGSGTLVSGRHEVSAHYRVFSDGSGELQLTVDSTVIDRTPVEGMLPLAIQHGGTRLRIGRDAGLPVSERYQPPFAFSGTLHHVRIETPGTPPAAPDEEVRAALHGD